MNNNNFSNNLTFTHLTLREQTDYRHELERATVDLSEKSDNNPIAELLRLSIDDAAENLKTITKEKGIIWKLEKQQLEQKIKYWKDATLNHIKRQPILDENWGLTLEDIKDRNLLDMYTKDIKRIAIDIQSCKQEAHLDNQVKRKEARDKR